MSVSPRTLKVASSRSNQPWQVEWHESLDSTMSRASALAAGGAREGTVVVADFQRQGRGTRGRTWFAPAGTCLMFSFVLTPGISVAELSDLPHTIACALRDALNGVVDLGATVKRPNDIMVGEKKLAGVLCQSHMRAGKVEWVVCGVGLNTNLADEQRIVANSTSLRMETGEAHRHDELLEHLLASLDGFRLGSSSAAALAHSET